MYISRHKDGNKVLITEQAIKKVKEVSISGYTVQQNLYTSEIRKELLRYARDCNDSNEVACLVNLERLTKSDFIIGDSISVNIDADPIAYHMLVTGERNSLELIHNHPGLSYFSLNDIGVFLSNSTMQTISIVNNQGTTCFLHKTEKYNYKENLALIRKLSEKYKTDKLVDKYVREAYSCGVERN